MVSSLWYGGIGGEQQFDGMEEGVVSSLWNGGIGGEQFDGMGEGVVSSLKLWGLLI